MALQLLPKFKVTLLSIGLFVLICCILTWNSSDTLQALRKVSYVNNMQLRFYNESMGSSNQHISLQSSSGNKVILYWVPFFSLANYGFGFGNEPFLRSKCSISSCETTMDRGMLLKSDALIFHIRNTLLDDMPTFRSPQQRWIFFLMESPDNLKNSPMPTSSFNWTMTYRHDSDIVASYFKIRPQMSTLSHQSDVDRQKPELFIRKERLVSWLVSACVSVGKREAYVAELMRYIPVDIYGKCGIPCNNRTECHRLVFRQYKFYLSFENSVCVDYVTEKFSNALQNGAVPIVYGGTDYKHIAPPNSYIDVRHYKSPRHLADYLLMLDKNDTLFYKYFEWKKSFVIDPLNSAIQSAFCDLCAKLHRQEPEKVYGDLQHWWVTKGDCVHNLLSTETQDN